MSIRQIVTGLCMAACLALALVGWFFLPQEVITQISFSGEASSTMAKPLAVLLPTLLGIGFGLAGLLGRRPEKDAWACTAVAAVSVLCHILMLLFNR